MKKITGKWVKKVNRSEFYEMSDGGPLLFPLARIIEQQFGLTEKNFQGAFHVMWFTYDSFTLDWDIWSGLSIFATSEEGEQVVREIVAYIETHLDELQREVEDKEDDDSV